MIITISNVEQSTTKDGKECRKVTGITDGGKSAEVFINDRFKDKWGSLLGTTCEIKPKKFGDRWWAMSIGGVSTPPPQPPPDMLPKQQAVIDKAKSEVQHPKEISGQEIGMWWKQLGDDLRSGHIDKSTPEGKLLRANYFAQMFKVLGIKLEKKGD